MSDGRPSFNTGSRTDHSPNHSDSEAIATAHSLAALFKDNAAERDRLRQLPLEEIEHFSASGLWAITVPRAFGGAEVSFRTVAKVIEIIAAADPSIGQIPQNHLSIAFQIRSLGPRRSSVIFSI